MGYNRFVTKTGFWEITEMSGDIKNQKEEVEKLNRLGRLVDRYAQSRSLGLLIPVVILVINVVLIIVSIELALWKLAANWTLWIVGIVGLWVLFSVWLAFKLVAKYEFSFYRKDGKIELQRERIPIWAWTAFLIAVIGAAILSAEQIMPTRWALTLALASAGLFVLYICKKEKETPLCIVLGSLLLLEVIVIAAGLPIPFADKGWLYSFFLPFELSIVGAGLIAMVVVHIYNRKILRKIKEVRPFGEQQESKSDS